MKEEWKVIEGYPNYSVSTLGRVRNDTTGKIRRLSEMGGYEGYNGYLYVTIKRPILKTLLVHRLVAKAFIPNPANKPEVNHIDGNHFNNAVDNLEWVTGSENSLHAYRTLHRKRYYGAENPCAKKVIRLEDGQIFECIKDAALASGIKSPGNLRKCLMDRRYTAGGYHWKYYEQEEL